MVFSIHWDTQDLTGVLSKILQNLGEHMPSLLRPWQKNMKNNLKAVDVHNTHSTVRLPGSQPLIDPQEQPLKEQVVQSLGDGVPEWERGEEPVTAKTAPLGASYPPRHQQKSPGINGSFYRHRGEDPIIRCNLDT